MPKISLFATDAALAQIDGELRELDQWPHMPADAVEQAAKVVIPADVWSDVTAFRARSVIRKSPASSSAGHVSAPLCIIICRRERGAWHG